MTPNNTAPQLPTVFANQERDSASASVFAYMVDGGRELRAAAAITAGMPAIAVPRHVIMSGAELLPAGSALDLELQDAANGEPVVPSIRLALGVLAAHLEGNGEAVSRAGASADLQATARTWLIDAMAHADKGAYPFVTANADGDEAIDEELCSLFDGVHWLNATSHSPQGWATFWRLCARLMPDVSPLLARSVYVAVNSRGFAYSRPPWSRGEPSEVGGFPQLRLFPLLDLANHHASPNVEPKCDMQGCWLYAKRPIETGEELRLSYGDDGPDMLCLYRYGFLPATPRAVGVRHNLAGCEVHLGGAEEDEAGRLCLERQWEKFFPDVAAKAEARGTKAAEKAEAASGKVRQQCAMLLKDWRAGGAAEKLARRSDKVSSTLAQGWARMDAQFERCSRGELR